MFEPLSPPRTTAGAFSSITTSSRSGALFSAFASLADDCLRRHGDVISKMGLERDDVRQLQDELRTMEDVYKDDDDDKVVPGAGLDWHGRSQKLPP